MAYLSCTHGFRKASVLIAQDDLALADEEEDEEEDRDVVLLAGLKVLAAVLGRGVASDEDDDDAACGVYVERGERLGLDDRREEGCSAG